MRSRQQNHQAHPPLRHRATKHPLMTLPTPSQTSSMRKADQWTTCVAKSVKSTQQANAPHYNPTQARLKKHPPMPDKKPIALSPPLKQLATKRGLVKTCSLGTNELKSARAKMTWTKAHGQQNGAT